MNIDPEPARAFSTDPRANRDSLQRTMLYTCQACARRKVKCDKATPMCSSCRKGKLECFYQAPPPRRRKRNLSDDACERLAQYERILHQHGLLPEDAAASPSLEKTPQESVSLHWDEPKMSRTGKLFAEQGKSRYMDSSVWRTLGDDEMEHMYDDAEDDHVVTDVGVNFASDPLTGAFLGPRQNLLHYHPTHAEAILLWTTHRENVEPICKILHMPTTSHMVELVSQQPEMASEADECVMFAIYHFAVFSMTEEECRGQLGQSRTALMQAYHFATRQALVNARFLRTTEMSILQALTLFLLSCRYSYDAHTYWILTGVGVRIGQRMGLHRDGEKLGLPPFEVQMRRRLFYQLMPLDGIASHMSGTGISISPDAWDTRPPLNVDDDQIWPGMTDQPEAKQGATDMIFCLARSCIGNFLVRTASSIHGTSSGQFKDYSEAELVIREAEKEVEDKYIRYCDIVNPLHFLTICSTRTGIHAMRLRVRLPKVKDHTVTEAERKELFQHAQKIIDTDAAAYSHTSLKKYSWHMRPFFLWGSWDSLIFILTSLCKASFLSITETDATWKRVDQVYNNHSDLLQSKRALYVAFGRLTLKAWDANPPTGDAPEPAFIATLRSLGETQRKTRVGMELDLGKDFALDTDDWIFWDQLIKSHDVQ